MTEDATIDRLNTHTLERLAHFTHTTELTGPALPFRWTNGVPTKPTYCHDTLLATPTPHWAKSWVTPCLPKTPTATVVAKQNGPKRGHELKSKPGHTRLMSSYLIRGMTIDRIRAFP